MDLNENMDGLQPQPAPEPAPEKEAEQVNTCEIPVTAVPVSENEPEENTVEAVSPGPSPKKDSPFADSPYEVNRQPRKPAYETTDWQFSEPERKNRKQKKTGSAVKTIIAAVLILAVVAGACGITAYSVDRRWENRYAASQNAMAQLTQQLQDLQQKVEDGSYTGSGNSVSGTPNTWTDGLTPGQVYAQNKYAVVAISNEVTTNIFGQISSTASSGSGFIISEDGYVVTNHHVIEGSQKLTVITFDGTEYDAHIVGSDAGNDLALLKINATGLKTAKLGSSDALIVGDMVVAIGNPLGELTNSLTVGYVSAKDRTVSTEGTLMNMLQTDAAINPGNSGGPLFNMKGEVVGITTAKYSGTTSSGASIEGIGFAIPIDDVQRKLSDLKQFGYVTGAYLGVMVREMDPAIGIYVQDVTVGYCAQKAGVKAKDVIVALGSYKVTTLNELTRALEKFKAGDKTTITVWRDGGQQVLDITLDEKPH